MLTPNIDDKHSHNSTQVSPSPHTPISAHAACCHTAWTAYPVAAGDGRHLHGDHQALHCTVGHVCNLPHHSINLARLCCLSAAEVGFGGGASLGGTQSYDYWRGVFATRQAEVRGVPQGAAHACKYLMLLYGSAELVCSPTGSMLEGAIIQRTPAGA